MDEDVLFQKAFGIPIQSAQSVSMSQAIEYVIRKKNIWHREEVSAFPKQIPHGGGARS